MTRLRIGRIGSHVYRRLALEGQTSKRISLGEMPELLHDLVNSSAVRSPTAIAVVDKQLEIDYRSLAYEIDRAAFGLTALGLRRGERVGVYLDKRVETVVGMLGTAAAGGVFVPINPILKPLQVGHIVRDCTMRVLITSRQRATDLEEALTACPDLAVIVLVYGCEADLPLLNAHVVGWRELQQASSSYQPPHIIDLDMAAIFYTSGSTGYPKGVVLSHRNLVAGAKSVSTYLGNVPEDRILSILPLSFDAGFSQLTTAFAVGAGVVLHNYSLPKAVVQTCIETGITGITGVPPLWIQLAGVDWPNASARPVRYFANTGGHMPRHTLDRLRSVFPMAKPYLMYGLTEAFRSTYLDPAEIDQRPDSIGKAIPNAEILVVRSDGEPCDVDEPGELVHRGALVSLGYWNDPERTAERFRTSPGQPRGLCIPERAVWSGDIVRRDADGFLYFLGRRDELIKTSGYRVSPTEIEGVLHASGLVSAAAVIGVAHPTLGQGIIAVVAPLAGQSLDVVALITQCRQNLPPYMVPLQLVERAALPTSPNGKLDRRSLAEEFGDAFTGGRP